MIEALMLFGSAARGENDENSDVDLLAISSNHKPFSKKTKQTEIQFIPPEDLLKSAVEGDLFALHLAFEGRVVFDTSGVFTKFKEKLVIRRDYGREIGWGSDLAWFLHEFEMENDNVWLVNKRIAWCVRTIAIAKLVEKGKVIFAPKALAREFKHNHVAELIELRRSEDSSNQRKRHLSSFLLSIGSDLPISKSERDFIRHFENTGNLVAIQTVKRLRSKSDGQDLPY